MSGPFEWISFDCYGTLIDWEEGILTALAPFLARVPNSPEPAEILRLYARFESEAEREWRPYREVLRIVARNFQALLGLELDPDLFVVSLPSWKPFPEVNEALSRLREKGLKLAIISNIDRDLLAETLKHFSVPFEVLVTAEEARAYKPYPPIFSLAMARFSCAPEKVFHVGQSLFHDILPARKIGWYTCWVKRPGRDPFGATPPVQGKPDYTVPDLLAVAELVE